jgi:acetoin utilization deacetylase AcuC-like enzyme
MAAQMALTECELKRVLVVDWDVHHGNGTQNMFLDDNRVLFFSMHRYDNGTFYPASREAAPEVVGKRRGQGFTVNVAWDEAMMGDLHYAMALEEVLIPIASVWEPELVLVSAGFGPTLMLFLVVSLCLSMYLVHSGGCAWFLLFHQTRLVETLWVVAT